MPEESPDLPTTAYAVLGLLSLRSWTGYEITQQAQRSFQFCWPKADSILYAQPPRLEALGFARSEVEQANGRRRNRYFITDSGRRELRRWLASDSAAPHLELEPLLRTMFADQATVDDARRTVELLRNWALERIAAGLEIVEEYEAGEDPFPERRRLNALVGLAYGSIYEAILEWTERADEELDRWDPSDGETDSVATATLVEENLRRARAVLDRFGRPAGAPSPEAAS